MNQLPTEVFECLANYLSVKDLVEFSLVSRYYYYKSQGDYVWKKKCLEDFNLPDTTWRKANWKTLYFSLKNPKAYVWESDIHSTPLHISYSGKKFVTEEHEVTLLDRKSIVDIESDLEYVYSLDRAGKVWAQTRSWSSNTDFTEYTATVIPTELENISFASISHGDGHCIGLARDGKVWQWFDGLTVIHQIKGIRSKVVQAVASIIYSFVLTENGEVWFVPEQEYALWEPKAILCLKLSDTIIQLAALCDPRNTQDRLLALTRSGQVLVVIALNHQRFRRSPRSFTKELKQFRNASNRSIWANGSRFAVCTENDVLFGDLSSRFDKMLIRHSCLENMSVQRISFGINFNVVLTTKGELALFHGDKVLYVDWFKEKYVISFGVRGSTISALAVDRE